MMTMTKPAKPDTGIRLPEAPEDLDILTMIDARISQLGHTKTALGTKLFGDSRRVSSILCGRTALSPRAFETLASHLRITSDPKLTRRWLCGWVMYTLRTTGGTLLKRAQYTS